jgi:PAS domain-containing protein
MILTPSHRHFFDTSSLRQQRRWYEMNLSSLRDWLSSALLSEEQGQEEMDDTPKFIPEKTLCERDYIIIDMLNSAGHEVVSFTVSDPSLPDNPLVFVSRGFCELTGYTYDEVVGKNCRFLQGKETKEEDVKRIRDALKEEKDCSVNLLNHKKDGTTFINEVSSYTSFPRIDSRCCISHNTHTMLLLRFISSF